MIELKATNHSYYCSDSNYYIGNKNGENYGCSEYETWEEFKEAWLGFRGEELEIDHDFYHCFRFDICNKGDVGAEIKGRFQLHLYFILQRKGIFCTVYIKEITEKDMPEIEQYLTSCWEYLKNQWQEVIECSEKRKDSEDK